MVHGCVFPSWAAVAHRQAMTCASWIPKLSSLVMIVRCVSALAGLAVAVAACYGFGTAKDLVDQGGKTVGTGCNNASPACIGRHTPHSRGALQSGPREPWAIALLRLNGYDFL